MIVDRWDLENAIQELDEDGSGKVDWSEVSSACRCSVCSIRKVDWSEVTIPRGPQYQEHNIKTILYNTRLCAVL
jgi:hypothetical protein